MSTPAEEFIQAYKELESAVRSAYNLPNSASILSFLSKSDEYRDIKSEVQYAQEVRNLLQHRPRLPDGSFAVEPTRGMIAFVRGVARRVLNRPRCKEIAVPLAKILKLDMRDRVIAAAREMRKRSFTCAPILEKGRVTGVFSENSLFNCVADDVDISPETRFFDIPRYISIDKRDHELFSFERDDAYIDELKDEFDAAARVGKRLGMVFLTPGGGAEECLTGIITPWDILEG